MSAETRKALADAVRGTALDRALAWFSPELGLRRMRARAAMAAAGQYTGASKSKRSLAAWTPRNGSADADLLPDMPTLRDRSRDLQRNAPIAAGAVNTVVTKTVGTGLALSPQPNREILGWDEEQAAAWSSRVEVLWRSWAETTRCDAARRLNFYQLQSLALRSMLEAGDVFVNLPVIAQPGGRPMTALQLIEAERICNPFGQADTARLAGGVEMDEYGGALRYHVLKQHPGSIHGAAREWITIPALGTRTGRRNILHVMEPRRPGQTRGVPYLAPVIESLKQLDKYSEAELNAAVISGLFAVFITSPAGTGMEVTESAITGKAGSSDAKASGWDGTLTPGMVMDLAPGEDVTSTNPGRPNAQFDPFVASVLRQVGMALELPYEVLTKHFASSYSAARAALLEAWQFVTGRRALMAHALCQPVYEVWLAEQIADGRISAPGFFTDPALRWAYACAAWIGDGPGSIDPSKEIAAAAARVELGVSTREKESLLWDGSDWRRNHEQLARERRMREADGLVVVPQAPRPPDERETEE